MMAQYRIVRDTYNGYEVQVRRWWFPFWVQLGFSNTHTSIERAEAWAEAAMKKEVKRWRPPSEPKDNHGN
jgi:hypothetical protein